MKIASNMLKRNKVNVFRMGKTLRWDRMEHSTLPDFVFLPTAIRKQAQKITNIKKVVIIHGDQGNELAEVAAYIILQAQGMNAGYREFHHDSYEPALLAEVIQKVNRHHGVTLLFHGFDEFSLEQQQNVIHQLKMQRYVGRAGQHTVRLIFSMRNSLAQSQHLGVLCTELSNLFDCQQLNIPPLRERPQDISELLTLACRDFRQSTRQRLHPDVVLQLQHYAWPGNTRELRRSIARLMMLSDNDEIGLRQANSILPDIITLSADEADTEPRLMTHRQLCDAVVKRDQAALRQFHPSVSKALLYLGEHFRQDMTLTELAGHSHISPSHLSYLLKHSLTLSFKQILNQTRIFYACQQLEYHPLRRITNLYLDCGYGDLSHFEKMFKRYTGLTPNAFRKKLKPSLQPEGR